MLLVFAGAIQAVLLVEVLLRRIIEIFIPVQKSDVEKFADKSALSVFTAACLQIATIPLQAVISLITSFNRYIILVFASIVLFIVLYMMSNTSVYVFSAFVRVYNAGVAPIVSTMRLVFVFLDVLLRVILPIYNGFNFFTSQLLMKIVVPFGFNNMQEFPELLRNIALVFVTLGRSVMTWLLHLAECTVAYQSAGFVSVCGNAPQNATNLTSLVVDCSTVFVSDNVRCFATSSHLSLDLLTPGIYMRQAGIGLQNILTSHCGVAALLLNLITTPLTDLHTYVAFHTFSNTVLYGFLGLPIATIRRCEWAMQRDFSVLQQKIACTPDWEPVADLVSSGLESVGTVMNNWLNVAALLLQEKITGKRSVCDKETFLADVVLDAGRAIEGIQSVDDLQRLQGNNLPRGETMEKLRVVGMTDKLIGVTNGNSVLYRSIHDGYVYAYSAWPFTVDVNLGIAAVTYSNSQLETDTLGQASTGLFACRCVDGYDSNSGEPTFSIECATAPYVQYIDDNVTNFEKDVMHNISFPFLDRSGLTCNNMAIKIFPMRWSRRRLATSKGGTRGYTGYQRFSFNNFASNWENWATQDYDAVESLRVHSKTRALAHSGKIDAAIYLQPICGETEGRSIHCANDVQNCYPWCMGVVKSGRQAQQIKMYNAQKWETNVLLTDVDCGIKRDVGFCDGASASEQAFMDLVTATTPVQGRCSATEMCTSNHIPGQISSFVPLNGVESKPGDDLYNVIQHKETWAGIRTSAQPIVVAGDVMLSLDNDNVVVTRLYDIGMSSMQMSNERLTLISNAHTVKVGACETESDYSCVAQHMHQGRIVIPRSFYQIGSQGASVASIVNPAVASQWAVHWAVNPELSVYTAYFEYCRNVSSFSFIVRSSLSKARVWTLNTMRSVDISNVGEPSEDDVKSRVSYMRVPDFFEPVENIVSCSVTVGLKIVSLEYLNPQNILVTVLAAEPRHYNVFTGDVDGVRHYRYYYLHPGRHDCVDSLEESTQNDFSCWRPESEGMWSDDQLLSANVGGLCTDARPIPPFGTMLIMPLLAWTSILENMLNAVSTFTACIVANPSNPALAVKQIFDVRLRSSSFHGMVDSAGAQLFQVDELINMGSWMGKFGAHISILAVNSLLAITGGQSGNNIQGKLLEKTVGGIRTIVMGQAKISEGGSIQQAPFQQIENLFSSPLEFSALHASLAVLTLSDNIDAQYALPAVVRIFMRAQLVLVSDFNIILRVGRIAVMRLVDVGSDILSGNDLKVTSVLSTALLEAKPIVKADWLDVMRFQCHGLAQMVGTEYSWGQALRHACYLLPDTIEGIYTTVEVLVLDYSTATCVCQLSQGVTMKARVENIQTFCLSKALPLETQHWVQQNLFNEYDSWFSCVSFLDYAHNRLHSAFDKTFSRLYQLTEQASYVIDSLLAIVTGDNVQCDAFDISPYVVALIPEPVDYFSHCIHTNDCRNKCFDEIVAFEQGRNSIPQSKRIVQREIDIPLESKLFSLEDITEGRNKAPFMIQDLIELPVEACAVVCGLFVPEYEMLFNRCVVVAGLKGKQVEQTSLGITSTSYDLANAYYCLPADITQFTYEWELQKLSTLPPSGSLEGFAFITSEVLEVYLASTFAAAHGERDAVVVLGRQPSADGDSIMVLEYYAPGFPSFMLLKTTSQAQKADYISFNPAFDTAYLMQIDTVKVFAADTRGQLTTIDVYGLRKDETGMPSISTCVRLQLNADPVNFLSSDIQVSLHPDFLQTVSSVHASNAMKIATHYSSICIREKGGGIGDGLCRDVLQIPIYHAPHQQDVFMRVSTFFQSELLETEHKLTRQTKNALGIASKNRIYFDMQQNVFIKEVLLSKTMYMSTEDMYLLRTRKFDMMPNIELLVGNGEEAMASWLQALNIRLTNDQIGMRVKGSLSAVTKLHIHKNCSLKSCDSCGKRQDGTSMPAFQHVENLCYAAQQCTISRCAGTLVNMRKPLCNIGKVIASDLHASRIVLQGSWAMIADMSSAFVEITQQRKQKFEVQWPDEAIASMTCTMKDNVVSTAASITSLLGAVSYLMQDISLYNSFIGSDIDSRVHARYIMTLTSMTNMIASIGLFPVYQILVSQKLVSCTLNDVSFTLQNLIQGRGQPELTAYIGEKGALRNSDVTNIFFGSERVQKVLTDANVAVCLTEDIAQSLTDASALTEHVQSLDFENEEVDGLQQSSVTFAGVLEIVSDAISVSTDIFLRTWAQFFFAVIDVTLVWIESILRSFVDVAQTMDWQGCKLPIIDDGMQNLGSCACGDQAYSIPDQIKAESWQENAFWCTGFLMLNEGDGSDLLVWNPYSLHELLSTPNILTYIACLKTRATDSTDLETCNENKPTLPLLEMQGVEVMQVITRCRANYQQRRWDEGVVMLALFSHEEITLPLVYLKQTSSAVVNDKFSFLRRKMLKLLDDVQASNQQSIGGKITISHVTWNCLRDSLNAGLLHHECDKIERKQHHFHYILPSQDLTKITFLHTDACKVFSNGEQSLNIYGLSFPGFLWAGSSTNHAPLAKLHEEILSKEERIRIAEVNLQALIDNEINPALNSLTSSNLIQDLSKHLNVDAFSTEGDELHQLLDCFFMGPFSNADFQSKLHTQAEEDISVPQYHRGNPTSRAFMPLNTENPDEPRMSRTGGSQLRRDAVQFVFDHINERAEDLIARQAAVNLESLKGLWTDKNNFYCKCQTGISSLECCDSALVLQDIEFGVENTMSSTVWNMHNNVISDVWLYIQDNIDILLKHVMTKFYFNLVPLIETQRAKMAAMHRFKHSFEIPIKTYDINDTPLFTGNETMWQFCTNQLVGLYATLPFKTGDQNLEEGRQVEFSELNAMLSDFIYDPAQDFDESRQHSIETVVDKILGHAHANSPAFWTHAHRYVASDSVWCEKINEKINEQMHVRENADSHTNLSFDESWYHEHLQAQNFSAPDVHNVFHVADVLNSCACSWTVDNFCFIPDSVCESGLSLLNQQAQPHENDELTKWMQLCETQRYDSMDDLLLVLSVLQAKSIDNSEVDKQWKLDCHPAMPSVTWGLLDANQQDFWYMGKSSTDFEKGWQVGAHNLATTGMNGLRISMLSPDAPQTIKDFVSQVDLGYAFTGTYNKKHKHTISQPVCNSTLHSHLKSSLDTYFKDVFFPMAHSVQLSPVVNYCSRWIIELALLSTVRMLKEKYAQGEQSDFVSFDRIIDNHIASEQTWKARCNTQLQSAAVCHLHGVFQYYPEHANYPFQNCAFSSTIKEVLNCNTFYYTESCLIYCDQMFYDPCLCNKEEHESHESCAIVTFDANDCQHGQLPSISEIFDSQTNEDLLVSSLSWPNTINSAEGYINNSYTMYSENVWSQLQSELMLAHSQGKKRVNWTNVHDNMQNILLNMRDTEEIPHTYCDDLYDYWPDVQHPVGFHNTPSCQLSKSAIRGFASWMSRDMNGVPIIDPLRLRNMTQSSQEHGKGHLLCDAFAYSSPKHDFNSMYLNTKWKGNNNADVTIPKAADPITLSEMEVVGTPSQINTETFFRGSGHSSDQIIQHSVGLIRDWAFWFTPHVNLTMYNLYNRSHYQLQLNTLWPHWTTPAAQNELRENPSPSAGFFLSSLPIDEMCAFPLQQECATDDDCISAEVYGGIELVCLINYALGSTVGICALKNTCFQHAHCSDNLMCSGEGECVQPYIYFRNSASYDINVQLYAKQGCTVDTTNLGMFETISDFAQSNGMCSFRNWYHYQNLTKNGKLDNGLLSVSNTNFLPTNSNEDQAINDLLKHETHPCDRTYMHSDYKVCNVQAFQAGTSQAVDPVTSSTATRTHILSGETSEESDIVRFCDMRGDSMYGFLNPYATSESSLLLSSQEIQRCSVFARCPDFRFIVQGVTVESRIVQIFIKNQDFVRPDPKLSTREYCSVDNQRCMAVGYLLGNDCVEATNNGEPLETNTESSSAGDVCVIDQFVLPLRQIVFLSPPDVASITPDEKLVRLRQHCPKAFTARFDGLLDIDLFNEMYQILYQVYAFKPYANNIQKKKLIKYANGLLMAVFGLSDVPAVKGQGGRGLLDIDHYLELSRCTVFITQELEKEESRLKQDGFTYVSRTSIGVDEQVYDTSPGSSLYLFDQYSAIFMPLRWFLQCVLFAKNKEEGGVHTGFLPALLNAEEFLSNYPEYVTCTNYNAESTRVDDSVVTLQQRLTTAPSPFIFTQKDDVEIAENRIVNDVDTLIEYALDALRVRALPDLFCIEDPDSLERDDLPSFLQVRNSIEADTLYRLRRNDINYGQKESVIRLFDLVETNIFREIRSYLIEDKIDLTDREWADITLIELLNADAIQDTKLDLQTRVHENFTQYPRYQFKNLYDETKLNALLNPPLIATYLSDSTQEQLHCTCSSHCHELTDPEFSIQGIKCTDIPALPCTDVVKHLLDDRADYRVPFLRQQELKYLILKIMQYEISNSLGAGVESLHLLRSPSEVGPVTNILRDLFHIENTEEPKNDVMDLSAAKHFNEFMKLNEGTDGIRCSADKNDVKYFTETNRMHQSLRACYNSLQEEIGWKMQSRQNNQIAEIKTTVNADILLNGFYPSFFEHVEESTFVRELVSSKWSTGAYTSIEDSMCFQHNEEIILMSPFWSEFFDVGAQNSVGCDILRSGPDNSLFIYDSLCVENELETCFNHPNYLNIVRSRLSQECIDRNGMSVNRKHIGSLKSTETPLCEKRPQIPDACDRNFGTLYGAQGSPTPSLAFKSIITSQQNGIWKSNNAIYKGITTALTTPTALAVNLHDIAGHCLRFEINSANDLTLQGVNIHSNCDGSDSDWWETAHHVNNIEQVWAYQHRLAEKNMQSSLSNDWKCPMSWLQKYHFDSNARAQERITKARSPSSTRNQIRFQHLTDAYSYAHPTKVTSTTLSRVRAAFFLSDMSACVETDATNCHSDHYLSQTIHSLMSTQKQWHIVAYESRDDELVNCDHILDWPHIKDSP